MKIGVNLRLLLVSALAGTLDRDPDRDPGRHAADAGRDQRQSRAGLFHGLVAAIGQMGVRRPGRQGQRRKAPSLRSMPPFALRVLPPWTVSPGISRHSQPAPGGSMFINAASPRVRPAGRGRRCLYAAAASLLLPTLAGCLGSGGPTASQSSASQPPAAPYVITDNVPAPGEHLYIPSGRYVALGDSFSSGEGVKPFHPETDHAARWPWSGTKDICHRSFIAYSQILQEVARIDGVAKYSEAPRPQSDNFVACSGAKTQDLWHWNVDNRSEPPQFDRLNVNAVESNGHPGGPVGLITMTMGGNDVGFGSIIQDCLSVRSGSCQMSEQHALDINLHWIDGTYSGNAPAGPHCGPGCNPYKACPPGSGCNPENLVQVYRALRQKAPHARILVLGYPREFRPNYTDSCQHIDRADQNWANTHLTDALNNVIQANIKAANADIEYVRTVKYFLPHEQWCTFGDPDSGFNGAFDPNLGSDYQGGFHPNPRGQQLLAQAVLDELQNPGPITNTSPSPSPSATSTSSCSSQAFLSVVGGDDVISGPPRCADGYALQIFTAGAGGQAAQFFFKEGSNGTWTLIEGGDSIATVACSTIPAVVLNKLGAQCPTAALAPTTPPSPTSPPTSRCNPTVFLKVMRSQGATVTGVSGSPTCVDGYAEQDFTFPQGPTSNYPTYFFYHFNGPLGWSILGGGAIGDVMTECRTFPPKVLAAFAQPARDNSGCPSG
jgi:lysophospholipase L1-like esterase